MQLLLACVVGMWIFSTCGVSHWTQLDSIAVSSLTHSPQDAGVKLKELIGAESVTFYVSPYIRSKQTYLGIREAFHDEQVCECLRLHTSISVLCMHMRV